MNMNTEKQLPIYKAEFNPEEDKQGFGLTAIGLVDSPAIMIDWQKMSKQQTFKVQNQEKKLLIAPAMVAGMRIYRADEQGEYYVYFDADTIRKLVYYFFKNKLISNFNLNHNPDEFVDGVYIVESWFTTANSKEKEYGFNLPEGSWMISVKVDNDEVWNEYVNTGKLKGFSIECFLRFVNIFNRQTPDEDYQKKYEKLLEDIFKILIE